LPWLLVVGLLAPGLGFFHFLALGNPALSADGHLINDCACSLRFNLFTILLQEAVFGVFGARCFFGVPKVSSVALTAVKIVWRWRCEQNR